MATFCLLHIRAHPHSNDWRVSENCLGSVWKLSGRCWALASLPQLFPASRKYVRCPPYQYMFFCVPPPSKKNVVLCLCHFGSVLNSEQKWESDKFKLARWSQVQLVYSSVALLAELVSLIKPQALETVSSCRAECSLVTLIIITASSDYTYCYFSDQLGQYLWLKAIWVTHGPNHTYLW